MAGFDHVWDHDLDSKGNSRSLLREKQKPDFHSIGIPDDEDLPPEQREFDAEETLIFLQRLAEGWGEYQAAMAEPLGWSPAMLKRFLSHPERAELIWAIHERDNEEVETAVRRMAVGGNPTAAKLWLLNKAAHRGWADRRTMRIEGTVNTETVLSVKLALEEATRAAIEQAGGDGAAAIAALQASIGLGDDPDGMDDVVDAELVEP